MRFYDRRAVEIPDIFSSEPMQRAQRKLHENLFETDTKLQSQRRIDFNNHLLYGAEVKEALSRLFNNQCAYCERAVYGPTSHVERFRPHQNARDPSGSSDFLYYAWLAYEWDNLLSACPDCNVRKHSYFPVAKGIRGEFGASIEELRKTEKALLIDPCFDDIAAALTFTPNGHAKGLDSTGRTTIGLLELNRPDLLRNRTIFFFDKVQSLILGRVKPRAVKTGFSNGWSSYLYSDSNSLKPFAGAFTLALRDLLTDRFGDLDDLRDGLPLLLNMPDSKRIELLYPFLTINDIQSSAVETLVSKSPPARSPKRYIDPRKTPTALAHVQAVSISNFKVIEHLQFKLPATVDDPKLAPCMLILGENAVGKSTVLEAICLALLGTRETAKLDALLDEEAISPDDFIHRPDVDNWHIKSSAPLHVAVDFLGVDETAEILADQASDVFTGSAEPAKVLLAYGPRRYFKKRKSRRFRASAYRVKSLFDPMAVIANPTDWLLTIDDDKLFNAAVRALRIVLMLEEDALIDRGADEIMIDTPKGVTPLSKLSVGYRSVVAIAIDIIQELLYYGDNLEEARGVVIIDEIETHLHPRWKMQIVRRLREAFPQIQFIMTTHDPLCLRGMYQGEVFVLQRGSEDGAVEMLEELPDVRGMRAEQILTSEYFGLGTTDPDTDAKVDRYHYLTRKVSLDEDEQEEREQLAQVVERVMMVGSSLDEQTDAAAMAAASAEKNIDEVPQVEFVDGNRKRLIREKLMKIMNE